VQRAPLLPAGFACRTIVDFAGRTLLLPASPNSKPRPAAASRPTRTAPEAAVKRRPFLSSRRRLPPAPHPQSGGGPETPESCPAFGPAGRLQQARTCVPRGWVGYALASRPWCSCRRCSLGSLGAIESFLDCLQVHCAWDRLLTISTFREQSTSADIEEASARRTLALHVAGRSR
jgi:hypothetical protein